MEGIKISQLPNGGSTQPIDVVPISRGGLETYRILLSQFVTFGSNVGTGTGDIYSGKTSSNPTSLQFRRLSADDSISLQTVGNSIQMRVADGVIDASKLRPSVGTSVIGRSAATTGAVADIAATSNGDVLRRANNVLGFGTIGTNSLNDYAVTSSKLQSSVSVDNERAVTTDHIRNNAITAAKLATNIPQTARAWCKFIGDIPNIQPSIGGTLTFTRVNSTTVEVSRSTPHGLENGDFLTFTASFGQFAYLQGTWPITVLNTNTLRFQIDNGNTVPTTPLQATTLIPTAIVGSYNISKIGRTATGEYIAYFSSPTLNANYVVIVNGIDGGLIPIPYLSSTLQTINSFNFNSSVLEIDSKQVAGESVSEVARNSVNVNTGHIVVFAD